MTKRFGAFIHPLILLAVCAWQSAAAEVLLSASAETPRVQATLVSDLAVATPGGTVSVALHQQIIDGWHTYWKNPGDSGEPIDISWSLPDGVTVDDLRYPVPEAIRVGPLMNYGYSQEVTLLSDLAVPVDWPTGEPVTVDAHATWLVCEEECIPEEASFTLSIPTGGAQVRNETATALFERARVALPRAAPWPVSARDVGDSFVLSFETGTKADADEHDARFFPNTWGHLAHAAEQEAVASNGRVELLLRKGEVPPHDALEGILTVDGSGYLVSAPLEARAPPADTPGIALLLALAFAGGVLLNLMPCVFPVLAVKAMGFVSHAREPAATRITGGLAYLLGVLASFAALAGVLLVLKAGGAAVGWGFHLQSPVVVASLALVLFSVGLSLSGLVEISGAWTGAGSNLASRPGATGSFFTGVLAAVVATPCTAPFMATAIGVALLQSAPVAMAVFLTLGLGLAAPYVALTMLPAVARLLPRPGAWMDRFKQLLAFPMYAAAVWLLWVLAQQAGADAVGFTALAMVAIALAGWAWRVAAWRVVAGVATAGALACVVAVALEDNAAGGGTIAADAIAERYDAARLDAVLAGGGAVFVNVTAAWCVTCKVNEQVALSGAEFRRALAEHGITYMKGDWTRRDPALTALLTRFGRAGVPLYVIFPRDGAPRVLPQVLTGSMVREALASA